jgi:hypothetical protein
MQPTCDSVIICGNVGLWTMLIGILLLIIMPAGHHHHLIQQFIFPFIKPPLFSSTYPIVCGGENLHQQNFHSNLACACLFPTSAVGKFSSFSTFNYRRRISPKRKYNNYWLTRKQEEKTKVCCLVGK